MSRLTPQYYYCNIHVQFCVLQVCVLVLLPLQAPPVATHCRTLLRVPPPQVLEQDDHIPHWLHAEVKDI